MRVVSLHELNNISFTLENLSVHELYPYSYVENYDCPVTEVSFFQFALMGTAQITTQNHEIINLEKGTLVYVPSNAPFKLSEDENFAYLRIYFDIVDVKTNEILILSEFPKCMYQKTPFEITNILTELANVNAYSSYNVNLKLISVFYNLFYTMTISEQFKTQDNNDYSKISKSVRYMEQNPSNTLTCKDFADICHLSESHYRKLFKHYMNVSPMKYNNIIKMKHACEVLKNSNTRVSTLSNYLGFASPSDFCHMFKKTMGISPSEYRKNK